MKPKERVLTAINHIEPDRVPIDYAGNPGIDSRLKKHFRLTKDDNEGLLRALNVDFRYIFPAYIGRPLYSEVIDRYIHPEWGIHMRWVQNESSGYWDYCDFPLKDAGIDEVKNWPMPSPDDYDYDSVLQFCKQHVDYAVVLGHPGLVDIINLAGTLRTMEQVLIDLITNDPITLTWTDRRLDIQFEVVRRTLEASKGGIDILFIGEDLGTQIAPIISLELFRKHIRPRHQKFIDLAKSFGIPVMIHSCGSSSWAFEDFMEMGIHVIDTLQPEAKDMSPVYLKSRFGKQLSFHGCISTAGPVANGTPDETDNYCRDILEIMKPGGGYCFAPTHQLQDNSPTDNVIQMYQAAVKYGTY